MLLIIITVIMALLMIVARKHRIRKLVNEISDEIPAESMLMWLPSKETNSKKQVKTMEKKEEFHTGYREAAVAGAIGTIPSFYYLSKIDENVLEAIEFAFVKDFSNFNNLHDYISDKYVNAVSDASAEGWMTRLEGYVTEQYAADVLEKMGHNVEFPDSANQVGWDMLVDGEPWQVKGGETASVISSHFEKYPEIPIVTNVGLANKFDNQENIMGLEELSSEYMHNNTENSLEGISDLGDATGAGIPLVTLALSGYREFNLLIDGKTKFANSAKNIGLDATGGGIGGMAGLKAGAILGGFGGPLGVAIGGTIGSVAGTVGGRFITNGIKQKSYKLAIEDYERSVEDADLLIEEYQNTQRLSLMKKFGELNQQLNITKEKSIQKHEMEIKEQSAIIFKEQQQLVNNMQPLLLSIKNDLQKLENKMFRSYRKRMVFMRVFFQTKEDIYFLKVKQWFEGRYCLINEAIDRFGQAPNEREDIVNQYKEIIAFFREHPANNKILNISLEKINYETICVNNLRGKNREELIKEVEKTENEVRILTNHSFKNINEFLEKKNSIINEKIENIKREANRLGIEIS
ncbi:hypothetical protein E0M27_04675 [Bacillus mycoides]|uniref:hypothetical protein n=1 Tax=Bacillus mycoides TaxID=1405 RepID=UPI00103D9227|nr:hypothetical protein [Bacillus mycoides]TBX59084.1 hypothetical protein E0M27_04675 [Bacillus mycoides]